MTATYTLSIIVITAIISVSAFSNTVLYNKMILWPRGMDNPREYYRLLSSGFIHADWIHLLFNMLVLYSFGSAVEQYFSYYFDKRELFLPLYLLGIIASSLPSFWKNRNNSHYRSLGASGGVAAVLFSAIYFAPWNMITIYFINVPGILAAVGYLIYSAYMAKKGSDNINHDAHFYGAVFGLVFTFLFDKTHGAIFFSQLIHPHF